MSAYLSGILGVAVSRSDPENDDDAMLRRLLFLAAAAAVLSVTDTDAAVTVDRAAAELADRVRRARIEEWENWHSNT